MKDFAKIVGVTLLFSLIFLGLTVAFSPHNEIGFDPTAHGVNVTDNVYKPGVGQLKK